MADPIGTRTWTYSVLFVALSLVVIFSRLLPLDAGPGRLPGPDLILCLSAAWVLRRPGAVPPGLIAAVVLLTDILFLRPLGLWSAIVVLGAEFLRAREPFWRDMPFLLEWFLVSVVFAAMFLGHAIVLAIFAVEQPGLGLTLIQLIATIAAYPVVVLFSAVIVGLRKVAPGAVDELGRRV